MSPPKRKQSLPSAGLSDRNASNATLNIFLGRPHQKSWMTSSMSPVFPNPRPDPTHQSVSSHPRVPLHPETALPTPTPSSEPSPVLLANPNSHDKAVVPHVSANLTNTYEDQDGSSEVRDDPFRQSDVHFTENVVQPGASKETNSQHLASGSVGSVATRIRSTVAQAGPLSGDIGPQTSSCVSEGNSTQPSDLPEQLHTQIAVPEHPPRTQQALQVPIRQVNPTRGSAQQISARTRGPLQQVAMPKQMTAQQSLRTAGHRVAFETQPRVPNWQINHPAKWHPQGEVVPVHNTHQQAFVSGQISLQTGFVPSQGYVQQGAQQMMQTQRSNFTTTINGPQPFVSPTESVYMRSPLTTWGGNMPQTQTQGVHYVHPRPTHIPPELIQIVGNQTPFNQRQAINYATQQPPVVVSQAPSLGSPTKYQQWRNYGPQQPGVVVTQVSGQGGAIGSQQWWNYGYQQQLQGAQIQKVSMPPAPSQSQRNLGVEPIDYHTASAGSPPTNPQHLSQPVDGPRFVPSMRPVQSTNHADARTYAHPSTRSSHQHYIQEDPTPRTAPWILNYDGPRLFNATTPEGVSETRPEARLYQYVSRFALKPTMISKRESILTFSTSQKTFENLAKDNWLAPNQQPDRACRPGVLQYRVRCVELKKGQCISPEDFSTCVTKWPETISVYVNSKALSVRDPKRYGDVSIDITPCIEPTRDRTEHSNTIEVYIPAHLRVLVNKTYFIAVEVIEILSHSDIRNMCIQNQRISYDIATNSIKACLTKLSGDGDDELTMIANDLTIGLIDPFTAKVFDLPVRGKDCLHRECFDLETFLVTRPTVGGQGTTLSSANAWKCPLCECDARPFNLRVDEFLVVVRKMLAEPPLLNTGVKAILVSADGRWKPKVEGASKRKNQIADERDKKRLKGAKEPDTPTEAQSTISDKEVIVLDD